MVCNYPNQSESISNVPETCAEVTAGGRRGQTKQNKEHRKSPAVDRILSRPQVKTGAIDMCLPSQ